MKILIVIAFYLLGSIGLPVVSHYCSGNLVSSKLFKNKHTCSSSCSKKKSCCQNKAKIVKISDKHYDNHLKITVEKFSFSILSNTYIHSITYYKAFISKLIYVAFVNLPPPDLLFNKIYKRICVYRI